MPGNVIRDTTRNYIVIHNDGANLNARSTRYVLQRRRLAYHYFIGRDGKIYQWKDLKHIALHAGKSEWNGITKWNDFSIGICLQGTNMFEYTDEQYESLTKLIQYINIRYPDSKEKPILRHSDVAYPQKRKKDPGIHFDLRRIEKLYDEIGF